MPNQAVGPRTVAHDYLQNFRYRLFEDNPDAENAVFRKEAVIGGFANITLPNVTIEAAEHRTGISPLPRKQGGIMNVEDITMTRGIVLGDTVLFDWIQAYRSKKPYRTNLRVCIYNQEIDGSAPDDDQPSRQLILKNCFPTSVKLMGDLDASASDINIEECTCSIEDYDVVAPTGKDLGMIGES